MSSPVAASSAVSASVAAPVVSFSDAPTSIYQILGSLRNTPLPAYTYNSGGRMNIKTIFETETTLPIRYFSDAKTWMDKDTSPAIKTLLNLGHMMMIEEGGEPAFIMGGIHYIPEGTIIISKDFKEVMTFPDVRRRNHEVQFPSGARWSRSHCWSLVVILLENKILNRYRIIRHSPSPITRETICSICLEDLSGVLVSCENQHQLHSDCYKEFISTGRSQIVCPTCRAPLIKPIEKKLISSTLWFRQNQYLNSTSQHHSRSWAFLGWLRNLMSSGYINDLEARFLIHSLHHYYYLKYDGTATFRLLNYDGTPVEKVDENDDENRLADFCRWFISENHLTHIVNTEHPFDSSAIDNAHMIDILQPLYGTTATLSIIASIPTDYDTVNRFKRWVWLQRYKRCLTLENAMMVLNSILRRSNTYAKAPFHNHYFKMVSEESTFEGDMT